MLTKVDFRFLIIAKASIEYEYLSVSGTSALKQGGSITVTSPTDGVVTLNILEQHFELMKKGRIQQQDQKMARKARKAAQLTGPPLSKSSRSNASSATFAANDDRQSGADAGASKEFKLVYSGSSCCSNGKDLFQMLRHKVGHPNRFNFAFFQQLLKRPPCVLPALGWVCSWLSIYL